MSLLGKGCDEQMLIGECSIMGNRARVSADMLKPRIISGSPADSDQAALQVRIFFLISKTDPPIISVSAVVLFPLLAEIIEKCQAGRI